MGLHMRNLRLWVFLGVAVSLRVHADSSQTKYMSYHECNDRWDVKHPYLVEVRYTGEPFVDDVAQPNYHKNRHGALITEKAVLTRGRDLDKFPDRANGETVGKDLESCMTGGSTNPCLYVNTRRPMEKENDQTEYCGQNIIVTSATFHPKFGRSPVQKVSDLNQTFITTQFPFVVLGLMESVKTPSDITIFPALVFPRTPLEMMYLYRRIVTIGHSSHLCDYPHYNQLRHYGFYGPYASPENIRVRMLDCSEDERVETDDRKNNRTLCWQTALCPEWPHIEGSWEGVRPSDSGFYDANYKLACWDHLTAAHIYKTSFIVFLGEHGSFATKNSPDYNREAADDKLGGPIVCNGVAVGIVSTWMGRGKSRKDAYVGTTLLRGWYWLLFQRNLRRDHYWHRAPDDSQFLGEKYKFKRRDFKTRNYDKSIFELSLEEPIIRTYSSGHRFHLWAGSALFSLLTSYYNV